MAGTEDFYLTLPSASSMKLHSSNRPSNFTTQLQRPINLTGKWEVALSEIHVPKYRVNVTERNNKFFAQVGQPEWKKVEIPRPKSEDLVLKIDLDFSPYNNMITSQMYYYILSFLLKDLDGQIPAGLDPLIYSSIVEENFERDIMLEYSENDPAGRADVPKIRQYALKFKGSTKGSVVRAYELKNERWGLLYDLKNNYDLLRSLVNLSIITGFDEDEFFHVIKQDHAIHVDDPMHASAGQYAGNQVKYIPNHSIFIIPPAKLGTKGLNPLLKKESIVVEKNRGQLATCHIPSGYYHTAERLISALNLALPSSVQPHLKFLVNDVGKCKITSADRSKFYVAFDDTIGGLGDMLGFGPDQKNKPIPRTNGLINFEMSEYPIDINTGLTSLYVYCDLIQHQVVGDRVATLLRAINVGDEDTVVYNYSAEPHYKPLVNNQISSVTIKIGSDIEDEITFGLGKTLAVLHLRQAIDNSKSIVSKWP